MKWKNLTCLYFLLTKRISKLITWIQIMNLVLRYRGTTENKNIKDKINIKISISYFRRSSSQPTIEYTSVAPRDRPKSTVINPQTGLPMNQTTTTSITPRKRPTAATTSASTTTQQQTPQTSSTTTMSTSMDSSHLQQSFMNNSQSQGTKELCYVTVLFSVGLV